MKKHIHYGILGTDGTYPGYDITQELLENEGFITDGDSFLVWGEGRMFQASPYKRLGDPEPEPYDGTMQVLRLTNMTTSDSLRRLIESDRERLARLIAGFTDGGTPRYRLADYVVVSDAEDWAEDQEIWTLDGILSPLRGA